MSSTGYEQRPRAVEASPTESVGQGASANDLGLGMSFSPECETATPLLDDECDVSSWVKDGLGLYGARAEERPTEPCHPDIDAEVALLEGAMRQLMESRVDAINGLYLQSAEAPVPSALDDWVLPCVALAIGAATAGIGGVVGAMAGQMLAGTASAAAQKFVDSAFKDAVDTALYASLAAEVTSVTGTWVGLTADARDAFFVSAAVALRRSVPYEEQKARDQRLVALGMDDPLGYLCALRSAVSRAMGPARVLQEVKTTGEWLNLLARADTRGAGEENEKGADLTAMGTGRTLYEMVNGTHPRGIVRVIVDVGDPSGDLHWKSANVAGLNPAYVGKVADLELPLHALGVSLFVSGSGTFQRMPATIEIGRSDAGAQLQRTTGTGSYWLRDWGRNHVGQYSEKAGVQAILDHVLQQPLKALRLTHG